jgi:hypothetical protein
VAKSGRQEIAPAFPACPPSLAGKKKATSRLSSLPLRRQDGIGFVAFNAASASSTAHRQFCNSYASRKP